MAVTGIVMSVVLIAAVVAWLRARRVSREEEPPEASFDVRSYEPPRPAAPRAEIWISLEASGSSRREQIVAAIEQAGLGDVAEIGSPTDILLETDDAIDAQREIRAILEQAGVLATMSVTRAADGDIRTH